MKAGGKAGQGGGGDRYARRHVSKTSHGGITAGRGTKGRSE